MVHPELAAEQAHVDRAYERVEVLQQKAKLLATSDLIVRASGPAATVERDVREATGARRLRGLRFGSVNLCFGRIDRTDGQVFHVGRLGVSDESQEPLVVDWRAPVAEAFYRATAVEPMGLRRRRHLLTRGRLVLGIDDEVLQDGRPPGTDDLVLVGEGALLESLGRARTGRMSDIVGTIQAEQDRIIRAPLAGTLVVHGGPGTGKTAVALHRAAYLIFTHRFPLEERGVLVVGPNPVFLRYIERVLPSLGESGCRLATTAELVETATVTGLMADSPDARRVKGDARMVDVMANALRSRQRPLARPVEVPFGAFRLPVGRRASASIVEVGRAKGVPHNAARPAVEQALVGHLFRRYEVAHARALEAGLARAGRRSRAEVVAQLRRSRAVRTVLDRIWPVLSPEQLLHDLLSREPLLAEAAGELLCDEDRHAVRRDPNAATWSPADLPLLDEADRLLGRRSTPRPPRAVADPDADAMVERMLDDMHEAGVLFAGDPSMTRDVRNHLRAKDRPAVVTEVPELRTYGHVVVDEAQDLSPMEWRMIARRCPSGSMTVVGDLGQASGWWKADSWADVMRATGPREPEVVELSVNYRTPSEAMGLAAGVLAAHRPDLRAARSVRTSGHQPTFVPVAPEALVAQVLSVAAAEADAVRAGKVAVIAPERLVEPLQKAVDADPVSGDPHAEILEAPVTVLLLDQAKGLEFDSVVVVEPAEIVAEHPNGLGALYVALTRTTDRLAVLHAGPLPRSLC